MTLTYYFTLHHADFFNASSELVLTLGGIITVGLLFSALKIGLG